jgi:hypothetical protein
MPLTHNVFFRCVKPYHVFTRVAIGLLARTELPTWARVVSRVPHKLGWMHSLREGWKPLTAYLAVNVEKLSEKR